MLFVLQILIQSVMETMVPKLVAEDIPLLHSLLSDVFPGVAYCPSLMTDLRRELRKVCSEMHLMYGENDEQGTQWVEKVSAGLQPFSLLLLLFCSPTAKSWKTYETSEPYF